MRAAVAEVVTEGFTHVAFGELFLEDVRRYREEKLAGTGLTPIFPLAKAIRLLGVSLSSFGLSADGDGEAEQLALSL